MAAPQPIKIAILAMGGEGGGVLADWLVDLGENNGHIAQATSVPGVAQRTGATIYYVELFPALAAQQAGAAPVLALMPLPGDVDIVLASELMEAARAVQRGLVTPDRTLLVASTHRVYAIAERIALGDGRADSAKLLAQVQAAARRFVGYDMARLADESASVISAVLFGALAGSGILPFARAQFEATIERGGVGVQASKRAFAAAFERAAPTSDAGEVAPPDATAAAASAARAALVPRHPAVQPLLDRAGVAYQGETLALVIEGLRRLVDYQDPAYAALYLERLAGVAEIERRRDPASSALAAAAARHLALWMSYEDSPRVAELKTRDTRFARVREEVKPVTGELLSINEYLHPRLQEVADVLPARLGRWLLASGAPRRWLERRLDKGRVLQTTSLRGYLLLSLVASLRRWRRGSLRHALEDSRIEAWLADVRDAAARDLGLALGIVHCQRLIKGYGDTHERGLRHFLLLRDAWRRPAATPALLAELCEAALADEQGQALQAALRRHALA